MRAYRIEKACRFRPRHTTACGSVPGILAWVASHSGVVEYYLKSATMKNIPRTGKRHRPKTAIKGKRYRCATCHKRSPRPVKTPAPWYCPRCAAEKEERFRTIDATVDAASPA